MTTTTTLTTGPAPTMRHVLMQLVVVPLRTQRPRLVRIALALCLLAVAEALFLLLVKGFVKALFQGGEAAGVPLAELLPAALFRFWPEAGAYQVGRAQLAVWVPAVILLAGLIKAFATYSYQLHQQALALYVAKSYRDRLFAALLSLPYLEIRRRSAGEWMSLIMNDVMYLQGRFADLLTGLVKDAVLVVACYAVLAVVHWPTALVLMALSPFVAFGMGRTGKRIAFFTAAFQQELARIAGAVLDLRARFDFIRSQSGEAYEERRFAQLNDGYYRMIRRSILVRSAFAPVLELLGFLLFALIVYAIGAGLWGNFGPDTMMQFFVALGLLLRPLREMGEQISRFHETKGSMASSLSTLQRMQDLAEQRSAQPAAPNAEQPAAAPGASNTGNPFKLTITSMKAGWGKDARFTATNLSLVASRTVAVIGPSGAGKSTLLKTLAGLVEPMVWEAGLTWEDATRLTTMVSQEPFLFDDTVAANLAYGLASPPATADVWAALELVNLAAEVQALPDGLATRLRAIGNNISGGQLQRLVIARSALRHRPLWLLDEATSAVDARSERDITLRLIDACRRQGQALVAVTHRLSWLGSFDEVWFIENGQRQLVGAHADLLAVPRYRDFCQTGGEAAP